MKLFLLDSNVVSGVMADDRRLTTKLRSLDEQSRAIICTIVAGEVFSESIGYLKGFVSSGSKPRLSGYYTISNASPSHPKRRNITPELNDFLKLLVEQ